MNIKKVYYLLFGLILLVPLGLISENPAWGEWEESFYEQKLGFIPQGIKEGGFFNALIPDYSFSSLGEVSSYYISAVLGVVLIFGVFFALKKILKKEENFER
jgi:hypothetical protein